MSRSKRRSGFTLIEVLIVVVIMAVLAATIIPQFSTSTKDARESSMRFNLQSLRTQVELYKLQHNGTVPDVLTKLTGTTDATGATNAAGPYGPYVQGSLPTQPFSGLNSIKVDTGMTVGAAPTATAAPGGGWIYRPATGELWIDHPSYTSW